MVIDYFRRGSDAFEQGKYDKAILNLTEAIRLKPDDAEAFYYRGCAQFRRNELDRAIEDFSEAIRRQSDLSEAYYERGGVYREKGDYDEAIKDLSEAIRLDPADADAFYSRGFTYTARGDYLKAIEDYSEAIRLKPDCAMAYVGRGEAYGRNGNHLKAIHDCSEAIRINPGCAVAYANRGGANKLVGNRNKALQDLSEAIRLAPNEAGYYFNRGRIYHDSGQYDQAIQDFAEAIRLGPLIADYYLGRAAAHFKKGNVRKAVKDLRKSGEAVLDRELIFRDPQLLMIPKCGAIARQLARKLIGKRSVPPSIPGWYWIKEYKGMQMYRDVDGDALSLALGAPDVSHEDDWLRCARAIAERRGGGLIEAGSVSGENGATLMLICKRPDWPAFVFTGILIKPRVTKSWICTVVAREHGMTGVREAVVTAQLFKAGKLTLESYKMYWAQDPYDPTYSGVDSSTLRYMSDAQEYDEQFPHHPLSKVRRELRKLLILKLDETNVSAQ